jgi:hypothetical protein
VLTGQANGMNEGGLLGQKTDWAAANLEEKGRLVGPGKTFGTK